MKKFAVITIVSIIVLSAVPQSVFAGSSAVVQKLRNKISQDLDEIKRYRKASSTDFSSAAMNLPKDEIKRMTDQEEKKLNNLRALIDQTPQGQLPAVLTDQFLDEYKTDGQYPLLEPYVLLLGEEAVAPLAAKYERVRPGSREKILMILGALQSKNALALVRKAMDDPNPRVTLHAQTALRLILQGKARPELEQRLVPTNSSWALQYTLREIALSGGDEWCRDFFRLTPAHKVDLHDLALIADPKECPEPVIAENAQYLVDTLIADEPPEIRSADIVSPGEFLSVLQKKDGAKSVLTEIVVSNIDPQSLGLLRMADPTELTGEHEDIILAAFNKTKNDLSLYPRHASDIKINDMVLIGLLDHLIARNIFIKSETGALQVKEPLSPEEMTGIQWFNIGLLTHEFPAVISKERYQAGKRAVARDLILKLTGPEHIRKLRPLLSGLLRERYGWRGTIEGFSERVEKPSGAWLGFNDNEADALIKKIAANMQAAEIDEKVRSGSHDFLTQLFLLDLMAKKGKSDFDFKEKAFTFHIEALDPQGKTLITSTVQVPYGQKQKTVLTSVDGRYPSHNITLQVELDRDKWLFHVDPLFIDTKPYGVSFDIYIPVSGTNETFLIEPLGGVKEKIKWRFTHLERMDPARVDPSKPIPYD